MKLKNESLNSFGQRVYEYTLGNYGVFLKFRMEESLSTDTQIIENIIVFYTDKEAEKSFRLEYNPTSWVWAVTVAGEKLEFQNSDSAIKAFVLLHMYRTFA